MRDRLLYVSAAEKKDLLMWYRNQLLPIPFLLVGCGASTNSTGRLADEGLIPGSGARLEIRSAEESPAPGLIKAIVKGTDHPVYLHNEVVLSDADIENAHATFLSSSNKAAVSIRFNEAGKAKAMIYSNAHIGKCIAIIVEGQVICAPIIQEELGEYVLLSGDFSLAEVKRLADYINGPSTRTENR